MSLYFYHFSFFYNKSEDISLQNHLWNWFCGNSTQLQRETYQLFQCLWHPFSNRSAVKAFSFWRKKMKGNRRKCIDRGQMLQDWIRVTRVLCNNVVDNIHWKSWLSFIWSLLYVVLICRKTLDVDFVRSITFSL